MTSEAPPALLPPLWVMKESRSRPGYRFCFNQETGECQWDIPSAINIQVIAQQAQQAVDTLANSILKKASVEQQKQVVTVKKKDGSTSILKSSASDARQQSSEGGVASTSSGSKKRSRLEESHSSSAKSSSHSSSKKAKEVRVLHILKKHKDSRRPASWRRPKITDTKEKAREDLVELIEILKEVESDPKELRATFEELAKTESDCSSAKRGGDLGFFGPKKMQPAFEKASFALSIGQLSKVVETSSGVHVLLRIG
jgi:NIMA-interacting peptidyl-prolyl cis-trans isomerase 1